MKKEDIAAKIAEQTPLTPEETQFATANGLLTTPAATKIAQQGATVVEPPHPLQAPFQGAAAPEVGEATTKHLIKNKVNAIGWKPSAAREDGKSFQTANFMLDGKETFCVIEGKTPKNADSFYVDNVRQNEMFVNEKGVEIFKPGLMRANFKGWNIVNETLTFREKMEILKDVGVSFNLNMGE